MINNLHELFSLNQLGLKDSKNDFELNCLKKYSNKMINQLNKYFKNNLVNYVVPIIIFQAVLSNSLLINGFR